MSGQADALASLGVLVVDDEADVRELLVEYFRTKQFDVSSAADGRAAQAAILKEPARYGLVLTDLQLPGVDGLGVLRTVKQANPSAYVVIVTGYASLDSAIQAVRLGAYDYLTKPFSLGQIDVVLQRIRDRRGARGREPAAVAAGQPARGRRRPHADPGPARGASRAAWGASRPCCATAATRAIASADSGARGRPAACDLVCLYVRG